MQDYIRRYFWLVSALAVVVCSFLAAKSVNHVIAGKFLSDSATPATVEPTRRARTPVRDQRSKSGDPMAKRNIFCAQCEPEDAAAETGEPGDPNSVPLTSLPLQLVATNLSQNSQNSFATIRNSSSESQGSYWVGNIIPEAGEVVAVAGKHVDFKNSKSNRTERISLLSKTREVSRPAPSTPARPAARARGSGDELSALLDAGIKKIDDTNYELDESLRAKVLANPMSVARGARIVPSVKNGKPNGFKLYAIRPSSVYAKIGFRNGDTVHAINGYDLTTPDKALEVYTKLKDAGNLSVTVTRRGSPVTLNYTVR